MSNCGLPHGCEDQCCLNHSGMCTLDTAEYSEIDRATEMRGCGFIGVNDRYLTWKYGVPYKDFNCGHCRYYKGETHGECTNPEVEPHTKGVKENGVTVYSDSKEYYSGAHACKLFKKQEEVREVPKQTYYTKCGRKFQKNSTAVVTGYEIDINDPECADCPFQVEVKDGWPLVHKRWECRAGSQPPNHETTWRGSLDDKNTIQIDSLDHELMEEIRQFCIDHPELGAAYNADCMADCRRTLSISCSSNKKGIAAKNELIEKFFSEDKEEISLTSDEGLYYCEKEDCPFNDREDGCCFAQEDHDECFAKDLISAIKDYDCENENVQFAYKLIRPEAHIEEGEEEKEDVETMKNENACPYGKLDLNDCRCINDIDGHIVCDAIRRKDWDRYYYVKEVQGKVNCETFDKLAVEIIAEKKPEKPAETKAIEEVTTNVITFDYSTVDEETGAFLQEKANRITEIRIKSVIAMGKELKEAQDKLADHDKTKGTFQKWVGSIGITPRTAYNYINGFDYVVKNFHNIEDAENIQPSLLFAASKPSAPKELADKVVSGDITTHKQYKELERRLKEAEEAKKNGDEHYRRMLSVADGNRIKAEMELRKFQDENKKNINALSKTVRDLQQQLEQAKRNSDPTKVRELGEIISEKQQEIETLKQQLHDKPIEVAATEVVEKEIIPDEVAEAIYCKIKYLYESIKNLTDKEMQIFAAHVDPAYYDTLTSDIDEAIVILEKISAAAYGATNMIEPEGHCGDCVNADMDAVTEEQLDEGKTLCTVTGQVVDIMDGCGKYKFFGAQS